MEACRKRASLSTLRGLGKGLPSHATMHGMVSPSQPSIARGAQKCANIDIRKVAFRRSSQLGGPGPPMDVNLLPTRLDPLSQPLQAGRCLGQILNGSGDRYDVAQDLARLHRLRHCASDPRCVRARGRLQGAEDRQQASPAALAAARRSGYGRGKAAIPRGAEFSLPDRRRVRHPEGRTDRLCPNRRRLVVGDVHESQDGQECVRLGLVGAIEGKETGTVGPRQ